MANDLTFQRERSHDVWGEIGPLLQSHWEEVTAYKDIPLNPDVEAYNKIEEQGAFRCYTARWDRRLIGYCAWFIRANLHYSDSLQAVQDVLFILPECRKGSVGTRLIKYSERMLKNEGCQVIYQHIKVKTPDTIKLFERLGYEPVDLIMAKRLDRTGLPEVKWKPMTPSDVVNPLIDEALQSAKRLDR